MGLWRRFLICLVGFLAGSLPVLADVVVSIKPLHALAAGVMAGVGQPAIIIDGSATPHAYALKLSQGRKLQNAKLILWMGPAIEGFLEKPVTSLGGGAKIVALLEIPGLVRLMQRAGGSFETQDDARQPQPGEAFDPHVWLDPRNAGIMVSAIAAALAKIDPANRQVYLANAAKMQVRLAELEAEIVRILEPVRGRPFVVFHDGFQYFENRFGLKALGSLTTNPEVRPGAGRVSRIQAKLQALDVVCIFAEPQFAAGLIGTIAEDTGAKTGILDPLGAAIAKGSDLYFSMLKNLALSFRDCLA